MTTKEEKLTHTMSFRIPEDAWQLIEEVTAGSTMTPHDWCRQVVLNELATGHGLTRNEQFILGEIAIVRYILTNALSKIAAGQPLSFEEWMKVERVAVEAGQKVADEVLLKRLQKRAR